MVQKSASFRRIKQEMLLKATSLARGNSETVDDYLKRVTHLHLQNKKLKVIENLDACTNLKVLYLYDNQIEVIENLGFSSLLSYVYLQNNLISVMPTLNLSSLVKLYLDDNQIQYVTGLENCEKLEEVRSMSYDKRVRTISTNYFLIRILLLLHLVAFSKSEAGSVYVLRI